MPFVKLEEKLTNLKTTSLSLVVEKYLEERMLNDDLQPGERINESVLAQKLGISRAPIREACRKLEKYGLLESRVGKGAFVRTISHEEALNLYSIRGVLDAYAAEQVSMIRTKKQLQHLAGLLQKMRDLIPGSSTDEYLCSNIDFHKSIVTYSNNASLIGVHEGIVKQLAIFRLKTLSQPERRSVSMIQHEAIYQAIADQNPRLAAEQARHHVEEAKAYLIEQTSQTGKRKIG